MRTMYEANDAAQITREQHAYNIMVLGLCETRWTQRGQVRLNTAEMILYSGHEEEDAHDKEGVAHKWHRVPSSAGRQQDQGSFMLIQNKEEKDQAKHHTVLCTSK